MNRSPLKELKYELNYTILRSLIDLFICQSNQLQIERTNIWCNYMNEEVIDCSTTKIFKRKNWKEKLQFNED